MCEFCPGDGGGCPVCGHGFDPVRDADRQIRTLRGVIGVREVELDRLRDRLDELLALAGRRPGDGSDQPRLFEPAAQGSLFG